MYSTTDFRRGLKIEYNKDPFEVVEFQHVKPGKGAAFVKTRIKNLLTGNVIDINFRSGDKFGKPDLEEKEMQFLYKDGDDYYFMDNETYEQIFISSEQLGDNKGFLQENISVSILFYKNRPIDIVLPNFVILKIIKTDPGVRGDTASGGSKPAELETGHIVNVPLFINEGEVIKIDTRTGEYVERA